MEEIYSYLNIIQEMIHRLKIKLFCSFFISALTTWKYVWLSDHLFISVIVFFLDIRPNQLSLS